MYTNMNKLFLRFFYSTAFLLMTYFTFGQETTLPQYQTIGTYKIRSTKYQTYATFTGQPDYITFEYATGNQDQIWTELLIPETGEYMFRCGQYFLSTHKYIVDPKSGPHPNNLSFYFTGMTLAGLYGNHNELGLIKWTLRPVPNRQGEWSILNVEYSKSLAIYINDKYIDDTYVFEEVK